MPVRAFALPTLVLLLGVLIPRGNSEDRMLGAHEQRDAEKVVARHFDALATNGFTTALEDYGDRFFQHTTRSDWAQQLGQLGAELGTFNGYTVSRRTVTRTTGASGVDTKVSLLCDVNYSKGSAAEEFTLAKGRNDADYRIIAHKIDTSVSRGNNPKLFFLAAGICGLFFILGVAAIFSPGIRGVVRWGTAGGGGTFDWAKGTPMSPGSAAASALAALVCGTTLLAVGARYEPVVRISGWLLGSSFVVLIAAHLRDWANRG